MNGTRIRKGTGKLLSELALMAGAALALALLAPFGMDAMSFTRRLFVWLIFAVGGYACFRPVLAGGMALSERTGMPRWIGIAVATFLASFPTTLIVGGTLYGWRLGEATLGGLARLYLQVLLVGALVTILEVLIARGTKAATTPADALDIVASEPVRAPEESELDPARLVLDKLPPALGADILYIENEDHYLRVHTARGNALVLMRLADAAEALRSRDGARVHRGWWVARSAVTGTVREGRAIRLTLVDGREAPVARSMVEELRTGGWL